MAVTDPPCQHHTCQARPACTGGSSCCSAGRPCPAGKGDCDGDDECDGGLKCGRNNCVGDTFDEDDDCCYLPDMSNRELDEKLAQLVPDEG